MFTLIDLGGAPAGEDCAQLGQTDDFDRFNRLEVECYRAALLAKFGPTPPGCQFTLSRNPHDFGTYYTLALKVWDHSTAIEAVSAYIAAAEDGLRTWLEAGFRPPVQYEGSDPIVGTVRELPACIVSALKITRPGSDGAFPIPDFAILHGNLRAIYPEQAFEALLQMGGPGN